MLPTQSLRTWLIVRYFTFFLYYRCMPKPREQEPKDIPRRKSFRTFLTLIWCDVVMFGVMMTAGCPSRVYCMFFSFFVCVSVVSRGSLAPLVTRFGEYEEFHLWFYVWFRFFCFGVLVMWDLLIREHAILFYWMKRRVSV